MKKTPPIKIDFSTINQNDFRISEREHSELGKVVVIGPGFDKHKWTKEEVHLRSLLCSPNGEVLSSGFPKFKNHLEDPELDQVTLQAIEAGDVYFTEKLDGSLVIRFVVNGKVYFRTRGSHELGEGFAEPIMDLVKNKYPKLLDPKLPSNFAWDILMEYTGPQNKIILNYEEPDLRLLGAMRKEYSFREPLPVFYGTPDWLKDLSQILEVPPVTIYDSLGSSPKEIMDYVFPWKDREGIVLRCLNKPNGVCGHLVKMKSDLYQKLHALKFQMTLEKVRYICWTLKIDSQEKFVNKLHELGLDFESVNILIPEYQSYEKEKLEMDKLYHSLVQRIDNSEISKLESRKDKALALKELLKDTPDLFGAGIQHVMGNREGFQNYLDSAALNISPVYLKAAKEKALAFTNSLTQTSQGADNV